MEENFQCKPSCKSHSHPLMKQQESERGQAYIFYCTDDRLQKEKDTSHSYAEGPEHNIWVSIKSTYVTTSNCLKPTLGIQ